MHRVFGTHENVKYVDREGAYLIPVQNNRIGVIQTTKGFFLIGGGIEGGESHTECIERECLEETGCTVTLKNKICSAETYCVHEKIGYFHPMQTYYAGVLNAQSTIPAEKDHQLVWIEPNMIRGRMFLDMQNWALEQYFGSSYVPGR